MLGSSTNSKQHCEQTGS